MSNTFFYCNLRAHPELSAKYVEQFVTINKILKELRGNHELTPDLLLQKYNFFRSGACLPACAKKKKNTKLDHLAHGSTSHITFDMSRFKGTLRPASSSSVASRPRSVGTRLA